jgi:hypothetical protein
MTKTRAAFDAWLFGITPRQREQLRHSRAHPVRSAAAYGGCCGVLLGTYYGKWAAGVVLGPAAGAAYGWAKVAWMRRRARRLNGI